MQNLRSVGQKLYILEQKYCPKQIELGGGSLRRFRPGQWRQHGIWPSWPSSARYLAKLAGEERSLKCRIGKMPTMITTILARIGRGDNPRRRHTGRARLSNAKARTPACSLRDGSGRVSVKPGGLTDLQQGGVDSSIGTVIPVKRGGIWHGLWNSTWKSSPLEQ